MKRRIAIVTVLALLLCGCNSRDPEITLTPSTQATQIPTTEATEPTAETLPAETEPTVSTEPAGTLPEPVLEDWDWNNYSVTLTQAGAFPKTDGLQIRDIPVIVTHREEGSFYELLSYAGENLLGKAFRDYDYFGKGIAAVYSAVEGQIPPLCQLVNVNTGQILISDTAAKIEPINDRYYFVICAAGQTEKKEEALLCYTDTFFSMEPGAAPALFAGSGRVYDLEKQEYVPELTVHKPGNIFVCGSTVCVETDWYTYDLYLENGTVYSGVENLYVSRTLLLQKDLSFCKVYDCNFNLLASYENAAPLGEGELYSDEYLSFRSETGLYGVMDMQGNTVLADAYRDISFAMGDYFVVTERVDENLAPCRGVVYADGSVVVPFAYSAIYPQESSPLPMLRMYDQENSKSIYLPGYGCLDVRNFNISYSTHHAYLYHGDYTNLKILIYSTFDTVTLSCPYYIYDYLIYAEDKIIEVLRGETLLEGDFRRVYCSEEYLYTLKDGIWTCYEIHIG